MEMQKIRFVNAICYDVKIQEEDECMARDLPFCSLQPLLENAIKHNELTERNPLRLPIECSGEYIVVLNNLQPKQSRGTTTGHGLSNHHERHSAPSGRAGSIG